MPSAWVERVATKRGTSYRVRYRVGGREDYPRRAGCFRTKREANRRKAWVLGELAAMRFPDLTLLAEPKTAPTFREVSARWLESRIDVADHTRLQHRSDIARALDTLGHKPVDAIAAADVASLVAELAEKRKKRETIRKTVMALAMVFDFAGVEPNPA